MLDFFQIAEGFLNALMSIGDFLLWKPFDSEFLEKYDFLLNAKNKFVLANDIGAYDGVSIGFIIFSASLVGVLSFKLIKFFLGIVTGS